MGFFDTFDKTLGSVESKLNNVINAAEKMADQSNNLGKQVDAVGTKAETVMDTVEQQLQKKDGTVAADGDS